MPASGPAKTAFASVGTTSFEALVEAVAGDESLRVLQSLGFRRLRVQTGRGQSQVAEGWRGGVEVSAFRFAPSLRDEMAAADLIICHAGAGTILEALGLGKPLLVVVNEALHDNHQTELAEALESQGHLVSCLPKNLAATLERSDWSSLKPWVEGEPRLFADWLRRFIGLDKAE